jgi:short-subunit dehydrogenase
MNWDGQVALVTGASSGIGLEMARQLADAGAQVFASARREQRLAQLAAEFPAGRITPLVADLAEVGAGARLVKQVLDAAGRLDLLVNNAGYGELVKADEQTTEAVARQMQVNFMAVIEATLETIPAMKSQGDGRILNVASIVGHMGIPGVSAYVASKHALQGWSEASGYDLKQHNITVTCLCPGGTDTEFQNHASFERHDGLSSFMQPAATVARAGLRGAWKRKPLVIPGLRNRFFLWAHDRLPWIFRRIMYREAKRIVPRD